MSTPTASLADRAAARGRQLRPVRGARSSPLPRRRLALLRQAVERAAGELAAVPAASEAARATEWLLDNTWLVHRAIGVVGESLPPAFCRRLPAVASGLARVELLARAVVEATAGWVDPAELERWIEGAQDEPLSLGELWALPAMVRWILVEDLAAAAATAAGLPPLPPARRSVPPAAATDAGRVPAAIQSLRALERHDWTRFVETVSVVERTLRGDPSGAHSRSTFETRNRLRKAVEELAREAATSEVEVARRAVELAAATPAAVEEPRRRHVGFWLIGDGRSVLETALGARPPWRRRLARRLRGWGVAAYLGALGTITVGVAAALAAPAALGGGRAGAAAAFVLCLLPASAVATALVSWLACRVTRPRVLAKLEIAGAPRPEAATVIAVPAMLSDAEEVDEVLRRAESNWLGNAEAVLAVALLFDFPDAAAASTPADEAELRHAAEGVRELNRRHGGAAAVGPFVLLVRDREWSASEQTWMGWERKRGKLDDFDRLVLGEPSRLRAEAGDASALRRARFAITLDADTALPDRAARRLIGALAHPLNRPVFDDAGNVVAGYTVLQPRVDIAPWSGDATAFARAFSGERGLDLYSRAVSDVYQDLFGEAIYVGKGIYDIAAFRRSLAGRVPSESLLSHDLFEGLHGRAGLVSDVAVLEEFPGHPLAWLRRQHRWIRGDWQIAPWLLPRVPVEGGRRAPNPLSLLDRWKIADNLRRSLLAPSLLALVAAGWLLLPAPAWWWTLAAALVLGISFSLGTVAAAEARLRPRSAGTPREWSHAGVELVLWGLGLAMIPQQALVALDAAGRAVYRMAVSRRHLLEWTPAYRAEKNARQRLRSWREVAAGPLVAGILAALLAAVDPGRLLGAAPLLAAWLAAPAVLDRVARPAPRRSEAPSAADRRRFRIVARRTWSFFESVLGPDDHWLPPDHVQEAPQAFVARRTSPTNLGLTAAAVLAAWDFGYLPAGRLVATLENLLDSLHRLERFRGHFLNWYDTQRLAPLAPRYVSTVDSGNLACSLIAVARGLEEVPRIPLPRLETEPEGLADALEAVLDTLRPVGPDAPEGVARAIAVAIADVRGSAGGARQWRGLLDRLVDHHLPAIESGAAQAAETRLAAIDSRDFAAIRERLQDLRHQAQTARDETAELLPWLDLPRELVGEEVPETVSLAAIPEMCAGLQRRLTTSGAADAGPALARLTAAAARATALCKEIAAMARRADALVDRMEFGFLYDRDRHLFRIGYDVDAGQLDAAWYDLLASEARAAGFLAIASGTVPPEHWVHLGRPFARSARRPVLLSWGGTLFEYLMPGLFLRTPRGSLLDFAVRGALAVQQAFARRHRLPWGISESAYHELDASGGYRYRAFGVPELALRREVEGRIVVAPYACCLAAALDAEGVGRNLDHLRELGALGPRGLYEAIDFGLAVDRRRGRGRIVRSYMTHHQAMILVALDNALHGERMVERFLSDRRTAAAAYLLYENTPERVPVRRSSGAPPTPARRRASASIDPGRWTWDGRAERPRVQVLSNGRWSTLISERGSGGARWHGYALTRWRADPTVDLWGTWIYLQDLDSGTLWSATTRPTRAVPDSYDVLVAPHAVEFHRHQDEVFSRLLVCVAWTSDVELRQVLLRNDSSRVRRIGVTSFGEVALARQVDDRRHPGFSKLFVESRFDAADRTLYFRRRGAGPTGARLAHAVILGDGATLTGWDTDRGRFLGRAGSVAEPAALGAGAGGLAQTQGATLDPAFALGCEVELAPGGEARLTFLTSVGGDESETRAAIDAFRSTERVAWAVDDARERAATELAAARLTAEGARHAQSLLSGIVYPSRHLRRLATEPCRGHQADLWSIGVSGDHPVVLLRVTHPEDTAEALEVLRTHAWLRRREVRADLVVLDETAGGYADPLHGWLKEVVAATHGPEAFGRVGGVHHVPAGRLEPGSRRAIEAAAAVVLDTAVGGLGQQLRGAESADRLPPFVPMPSSPLRPEPTPPLPAHADLVCPHGRGGLAADGRSYVIRVEPGRPTPAPWCGVVASPHFGFLVSERGGGFTWSESSGERRLTPWSDDPVLDPPGEAIYLRDEETGEVWSATPAPAGAGAAYEARHGAGFSDFLHHRHGLSQWLRLSVAPDAPIKISRLELTNLWQRPRRLTVTCYAEWTLGVHRDVSSPHVTTELAADVGALLAEERFSPDFAGRVAFLAASEPLHGFTADRQELLGEGGPERPDGLRRIGLGEMAGAGLDPCAALQVHVDLAPGERRDLHFLLGEGAGREEALELVDRFRRPAAAAAAEREVRDAWDERLGRLEVRTPEPAMDALLNRWLPYQALACRLWARTGFYQSSGAFGFRDQLQDSLAFLTTDPGVTRAQILECARRQFVEGDVLHWWHPASGAGIRTRCSDDLVWLPYAIAAYVEATGDRTLLDLPAPFLTGSPLAPGETERYDRWREGPVGSLYEHGRLALARAWTHGPHGLPLIGSGDWNDGMDRVGSGGRGESVWLGWFLLATARAWEPLCATVEGAGAADRLRRSAGELRQAVERHGWDGAWYRRAYYDDGTPLGAAGAAEAEIDSIAQSWAVLSGSADPERARRAVDSALELLVSEEHRLALLLQPPFDRGGKNPGYIKSYPPGVRENGGQYTHAAVWLGWACAELGDGDRAEALFRLLNPLLRARSDDEVDRYRVEPYVVAADIYGAPPHVGRGGWTWYTGSAGWMWRLGVERILGIRRRQGAIIVDPCIPRGWPGFEARIRLDGVEATIRVENPSGVCGGIASVTLDGRPTARAELPLGQAGRHELVVRLGQGHPAADAEPPVEAERAERRADTLVPS